MQRIAFWLVQRPHHGVLGLAGVFILLPMPIFSGGVLTLLILQHGLQVALAQAGAAGAVLVLLQLVFGGPVAMTAAQVVINWLPVVATTWLLATTRSLTLVLQVSVVIAMLVTLGFFVVLGDPTEYWNEWLAAAAEMFRAAGLQEFADVLRNRQAQIVEQMTMLFVLTHWLYYVLALLLGYAVYQTLPEREGRFGRIRDLNLGRFLGLIMAVASVLAVFTGWKWLQNVAFVAFAAFWLQGMAVLHWWRHHKKLPTVLLMLAYALLPLMNMLHVIALAVLGYTDVWFGYRTRPVA